MKIQGRGKSSNLVKARRLSAMARTRQPSQVKMMKELRTKVGAYASEREAPSRASALGFGDISKKMESAKQSDRARNLAQKKRTR